MAPRLLFVMVDALGDTSAYTPGWMPRLQARLPKAARGTGLASFPTLTPNGLRALLSGRTGVPEPVFLGGLAAGRELDSVLSRATAAGRRVHAIGQQDWPALFDGHASRLELVAYLGRPEDEGVLRRALAAARGRDWHILALHLFDLDGIGHKHGVGSAEHRAKLLWLDEAVADLAAAAGPRAAVLVVGDHGQAPDGGHGGMEADARRVPYVLWGPGVRPGELGRFALRDSAPTLAALLGLPPPILSEGWPLLEALDLTPKDKAAVMLDLLEQRRRRWLAAKQDWPWLKTDPSPELDKARGLRDAKDYAAAFAAAKAAVEAADRELGENSPGQWAGKLVWTLWLLVLAGAFAAAWPEARPKVRLLAASAAALCAGLLACPLLSHSLWPVAAAWSLAAAAALLLLSLASGLGRPALSWPGWALLWLALLGIASSTLLDASLWSWCVVLGMAAAGLRTAQDRRPWLPALAALAFCACLSGWSSDREMSALRALLPGFDLRRLGAAPWLFLELPAWGVLAVLFWRGLRRGWRQALPLAASLALLGLSRWLCGGEGACLLSWAAVAGWLWAALPQPDKQVWAGLGLAGFCLWAYAFPGGRLDFSHITVAEAYAGLGDGFSPRLLALLVAVKPVAAFLAPVLPLLAGTTVAALPAAAAVFGACAAGSLTLLWFDKFYFKLPMQSLVDSNLYERLLVGAALSWIVLLAWAAARALRLGAACGPGAPAGSPSARRPR